MNKLSNISIRKKMLIIILGISIFTIVLGMSLYLIQDIRLFREDIKNNSLLNAKITSEYCAAPLLFEYKDEASNILAKLKTIPNILNVALYDDQGKIFAEFTRSEELKIDFPNPENNSSKFEGGFLHIFQKVEYQGSSYGSLYLRVSTEELTAKIYEQLALLVLISLILMGLAYLLANRFQKIITEPILNLANITNNLSTTNDYSLRVNPKGKDEISTLYSGFNNMLEQIENRDKKITDTLKALTTSEQRYKLAVSAGKVGVWEWEVGSDKVFCDESIRKLLGYEKKETSDGYLTLKDFVHEEDINLILTERKQYLSGLKNNYELEYRAKKRDGNTIWFISKGQYQKNEKNEIIKIVGSDTDITQKKIAEQMEKDKLLAEEANKAKSEFLARMSHEIRTPMNAIIGLSFMALKTELTAKQQDYLVKINTSANSLLGIINDILDFSKIEAGKLDIEKIDFNLEEVFTELTNTISEKAQNKKLEFIFGFTNDIPLNLVGDPLRLRQILINLCNNAVKFTEEGTVSVIIQKVKEDDKKIDLLFRVSDTGIGIEEEKLHRLFKSFSQIDTSTTREYGGTGLGLVISQRLIELMDGKIWVDSVYGEGTTFSFNLSFEKQDNTRKKEFNLSSTLQQLHVLVCDDNQMSLELLTKMLGSFNLKVTAVSSGFDAEKKISEEKSNPFKLAIIDWMMPKQDGLETIKNIIANTNIEQCPKFIMITAYGLDDVKQKAEKIGINKFLIKPITYSTLYDTIMEIFGESSKTQLSTEKNAEELNVLTGDLRGASILLTEDNQINQQVAVELLESFGIRVTIANNGEEALNIFKEKDAADKFDLILMDIQMPVMDGYNATENLRKIESLKNIPIIAMTADAVTGVREKCLNVGMNDYLTKPINANELAKILQKWLQGKELKGRSVIEEKIETHDVDKGKIILPKLEYVNTEEGLNRVAGNKKLYINLLKKFYNSNKDFIEQVNNAYMNNDTELIHRLIHTLKGVSGNLGMQKLFETAKRIEQSVREEGIQSIVQKLNSISELLNPILSSIENLLLVKELDKPEKMNENEYLTLIKELEKMIVDYNADALIAMDNIKYDHNQKEHEILKAKLQQYDFDAALEIIRDIITISGETKLH